MLPMTLLQTSELAIFDRELGSSSLLPEEALRPSATFTEALQLRLEAFNEASELRGMGLPPYGKPLPDTETVELELTAQLEVAEIAIPLLEPSRIELPLRAMPTTVQPVLNTTPGTAATVAQLTVQTPLDPTGFAPTDARPATQAIGTRIEVEAVLDNAIRAPRNDIEAPRQLTAVAPEPSIGQTVREMSSGTTPAAAIPAALREALGPEQKPGPRLNLPGELPKADTATRAAATATADSLAAEPKTPLNLKSAPAPQPAIAVAQTTSAPIVQAEVPTPQPLQISATQTGQQLAQPATEASPAPPQLTTTVATPVRDAAWGQSIGERVLVMASNKLQSAEIRLTPAELGPLRIQVSVDDGAADVMFLAQHAVTREALEQAMPRLRELLAENGLTLNQSSIGEHSDQGVQHDGRDGESGPASQAKGDAVDSGVETTGDDAASAAAHQPDPDSLVDTFA